MFRPLAGIIFYVVFLSGVVFAAPNSGKAPVIPQSLVQWLDYNTALEKAKTEPKLIFVDMYADWCIPCRVMDKNVYMNPTVASILNKKFYPVKLDVDSEAPIICDGKKASAKKCFSEVWELNVLPSFVLIAPKGLSILTVADSMSPQEMQMLLDKFLEKEKEWIER
ncbi:MAG: thioredoxin family protein [Fibrobacter sp.]|nr:thioredoxin family protein [Fibrobacter sp.]